MIIPEPFWYFSEKDPAGKFLSEAVNFSPPPFLFELLPKNWYKGVKDCCIFCVGSMMEVQYELVICRGFLHLHKITIL